MGGVSNARLWADTGRVHSFKQGPATIRMRCVGIHGRYPDDSDLTFPMHQLNELLELAALTAGIDDFASLTTMLRWLVTLYASVESG
jgi:hypothetical protein